MANFYIENESEDTFGSTDSLEEAIQIAKEAARQGPVDDLVTILDSNGMGLRQFVLREDGIIQVL